MLDSSIVINLLLLSIWVVRSTNYVGVVDVLQLFLLG